MEFELKKTLGFEAAHMLPNVPVGHKCRRLHGHSFKVTFVVRGPLHPEYGWVIDYSEITNRAGPIIDELDHHYLNEIPGLENPTSEVLARWIYKRVSATLPQLTQVKIQETCTSECTYPAKA